MALAEFVVMFREVFEIALVLGIMLAYLWKTKNWKYANFVYAGAALAVLASVAASYGFEALAGGFEENEELFGGITLVVAAALVTWLVVWMFAQKNYARGLERGVQLKIEEGQKAGLAAFAFIAVFREGVEIVLFLYGITVSTGALNAVSAAIGGALALLAGYAFFQGMLRLDMQKFFLYTSALLILLAAGLLSQGVHELQEAGVLPTSIEHVYDITPSLNADGSYPLLHEKGLVGAMLKGLAGYDTAPSLEQLVAYLGYLLLVYLAYKRITAN